MWDNYYIETEMINQASFSYQSCPQKIGWVVLLSLANDYSAIAIKLLSSLQAPYQEKQKQVS
ncbi:MAG: hypothetical protein F6J86_36610 [Symploca sp. SIO1B1]|nr:hypothetical protein [Symploca sp. SIO1C2]NER99284.1 hypothetical protein [Symploca sp. SIO1B1]